MVITHALKMRIYPNKEQSQKIDKTIDCCRYVYNHMLYRTQKSMKEEDNIYLTTICKTFFQR